MRFISTLFSSDGFMPHGHCYFWNPGLVWLHVISDSLIALAYLAIPATLIYIARKRRDLPFDWMLACFGVFILACGATHALEVWTLWVPTYWLSGTVKAIAAAASIATAFLLVKLIPQLLAIPSPALLKQANSELESRVATRTAELAKTNEALEVENAERKRAAEALIESESRFSGAFEHAPIGVALLSPDGRWIKVNKAVCDVVGYSEAELLERTFQDITHPEDLESDLKQMRSLLAGEIHSYQMEKRYLHARGHIVAILLHATLVRDARGAPLYFVSQIQDITERKRAEAALLESEERFRGTFAQAAIGIAHVSTEGRFMLVNDKLCEITGYRREELLSLTYSDLTFPEDREESDEARRAMLARELSSYTVDKRYRQKNGEIVWVNLATTLHRTAAGEPKYFISVFEDITARRRTEDALRVSDEKFQQLARNVTDVFWIRSPDMRELHYVSPAFERIWGRSLESLYANPMECANFIFPDDRARALGVFRTLTNDAQNVDLEYRIMRPDGELRWVRVRGFQVRDPAGKLIRLTGIVTDITARHRAEEELSLLNADLEQRVALRTEALFAATQEAERANRAKSDFLSRASHELRTPLNAILGFGQLLELDQHDARDTDNVAQILKAGRELLELINGMLDISCLEAGGMDLTMQSCAVGGVMEEALAIVRPRAVGRDVALGGLVCDLRVMVDRPRFKQVILNLLVNAIKFNRQGGRVTIAAHKTDGSHLRLTIADTGPGMAAEDASKVFMAFERLSVSNKEDGIGLGLAISRRIVELMGGRVGVESVPGEGSAFWVEVPLAENSGAPVNQSEPPSVRHPQSAVRDARSILYLEDGLANLRLMTRILSRRPAIELFSATTADHGVELARERRPDLILVNGHLSGSPGLEILARLRADLRTCEIPVVVIGADEPPGTRERTLAAGARAFLPKPLEVRILLQAVDQILNH